MRRFCMMRYLLLQKSTPSEASCSAFHSCSQWLQEVQRGHRVWKHFQPMQAIKDIFKTLTFMLAYLWWWFHFWKVVCIPLLLKKTCEGTASSPWRRKECWISSVAALLRACRQRCKPPLLHVLNSESLLFSHLGPRAWLCPALWKIELCLVCYGFGLQRSKYHLSRPACF